MDLATFVVEMPKALAWPATLGIALISYRKLVLRAFDRLHEVNVGSFGAKFATEAKQVREQIQAPEAIAAAARAPEDELLALAESSPRGAVIESWIQVEKLLKQLADKHGVDSTRRPFEIARKLRDMEALNKHDFEAVEGLRNLAAHASDQEMSSQKAVDFLTLSSAIQYLLRRKLS